MEKKYQIKIDNIDYTRYVQLPFSVGEKITEAYDSGVIVVDFTKIKKPFRKNALVEIHILDGVFPFDGKPYYFFIASDKVEESLKNPHKTYYKHTISVIEPTKKGDNIYLSPFSNTNRANATWLVQSANEKATWSSSGTVTTAVTFPTDQGTDFGPNTSANIYYKETYKWYKSTTVQLSAGIKQTAKLKGNMPASIYLGNSIPLPIPTYTTEPNFYWNGEYLVYRYQYFDLAAFVVPSNEVTKTTKSIELPAAFRYYIRNKVTDGESAGSYKAVGTILVKNGVPKIVENNSGQLVLTNGKPFITGISEVGTYDIRISLVQYNTTYDSTFADVLANLNTDWATHVNNRVKTYTSDKTVSEHGFETTISIIDDSRTATLTSFHTFRDVMDKIVSMINPDYGVFTYDIPFDILETAVPDIVFDGVKSLSEILFELARVIRSVPIISPENVITFESYIPQDNPAFNVNTEKLSLEYDSGNYASGFVSDLKNIVNVASEDNIIYSYYPGKNLWTKGRGSGDISLSLFYPDNAVISIDNASKGIYAIKSIKVKNFWKGGEEYKEPSGGLDITDFCWEKTAYESLYRGVKDAAGNPILSNTCQANAIYYQKGTREIVLSTLSENEAVALFGDANSATFQLENAIACAILRDTKVDYADAKTTMGSTRQYSKLKDIQEYQFQVCYIEEYNAIVKTQQFDMSSFAEPFDTNYNQESQTVSAASFGIVSQEEISRRGNETIQVNKIIKNLAHLPRLGETLLFEDDLYLADEIEYNFYENYVGVGINFTKDYNKINSMVQISREYRQYEISPNEKVNRNVTFYDYIYINQKDYLDNRESKKLTSYTSIFPSEGYNKRKKFPSCAVLYFKDKNNNLLNYTSYATGAEGNTEVKTISPIILPLTPSIMGNSLVLSVSMQDNFSAGNMLTGAERKYKDIAGVERSGGLIQSFARYVDDYGEAEKVSMYIIDADKNLSAYTAKFPYAIDSTNQDLPEATAKSMSVWGVENYPLYKDMNERLSFIYQLCFCTEDSTIKWHPAYIRHLMYDLENGNALYSNDSGSYDSKLQPTYYGIYNSDFTAETIPNESKRVLGRPSANNSGNLDEINAISVTPQDDFDGYALVLPKTMEVLFHVNEPLKKGVSFTIPKITFSHFDKIIKS